MKEKKAIYLIDPTHESVLGLGSDTMPLQLGFLGSYCLKKHEGKVEIEIFKFMRNLKKAIKNKTPFVIGVSNYLWNIDLSYKLISLIKEKYPETIVVYGGPNYPEEKEEQIKWLREHPVVDFYIYKDGEISFSRLVDFLLNNNDITAAKKAKLSSCHALIEGEPYFGELEKRIEDLDIVPSPYTTGLMDKFFRHRLIPPVLTHRGCPFSCTYCTEGNAYYNKIYKASLSKLTKELDYIANHTTLTGTLRIADSNFGMYEEDVNFCEHIGKVQKRTGYPDYLCCSTGKNQKERVLKCNEHVGGIMRFCASVQSLDPVVLKNIKRTNITLDDIMSLSDKISDSDTHSYSEIILGLPGDSKRGQEISFSGLIESGISNITQHQLSVIHGTEIGTKFCQKQFRMKNMFRPIQRCVGTYSFGTKRFNAIEIEEICVANNTLSFDDYLEARKLYLTVGMFYNDRMFGEIRALLRFLNYSVWEWIKLIHDNQKSYGKNIRNLYEEFMYETKNELWETREELIRDVNKNINEYNQGKLGGNIIYKYRSKAMVKYYKDIHKIAFLNLREYLGNKTSNFDKIINDLERFSHHQKDNIFDTEYCSEESYGYNFIKMMEEVARGKKDFSLANISGLTKIRITHTDKQKDLIRKQLKIYGSDLAGLTMLISRFPIKRLYRRAQIID